MMLKGSTKIHDFAPHKRSDQLPYALKGHQDTAYLFGLYVFQDRKHFLSYKAIYIDISVIRLSQYFISKNWSKILIVDRQRKEFVKCPN